MLALAITVATIWFARRPGSPAVDVRESTRPPRFDAAAPNPMLGKVRPSFALEDLDGNEVLFERFDGDVVVLNFWATWCKPCVEEIPMLIELSSDYASRGVKVIGVAIDDAEPANRFAREAGVPYPLLVDSRNGFDLVADYGNRRQSLPYTVFIDRQGIIRATHLGKLTRAQADVNLDPLL